ncbi:unnamed protein product [Brassicogethes aeneus]|uniref:G-patch domain-containing protein n=1 Tax=Brassicogethes aeneus TaxID=1431903 RepID=A0A9P0FDL8_BRAAE|nr:unnamed protein product [Brassicogethes aeneus]
MAMLAERKRKQKWSLNPRGKDWVEDPNKFGQKMLEKMGWSSGKGLGAKENGITEHIKVSYKNDSKGMGYKECNDQWTEHETNFSALLESLSGQDADISKVEKPVETSLEKKSQSSKARVHYHKFTRGKDLSRYSEKDLANIFGKRTLKEKKIKKTEEPVEENNTSKIEENSSFHFNRGSMADYFKKKMPNFGKTNQLVVGNNGVLKYDKNEEEEDCKPSFGFGFNTNEDNNTTQEKEEESTKSKKKMTFVSYVKSTEEEEEEPSTKKRKFNNTEESTPKKKLKVEREDTPKEKKKKNKKSLQIEENLGLANPAFDPLYNNIKIEKHSLEIIEESQEEVNETQVEEPSEKPKKKKKKSQNNNEEFEAVPEEKKKKKKNKSLEGTEETTKKSKEEIEEEAPQKPKKKKLKSKNEESCFENTAFNENNEDSVQIEENPYEVKPKKNKKKRKIEETGFDNPNLALEDSVVIEETEQIEENPYEVKIKKKKDKKNKGKKVEENGVDNPNFSVQASEESPEISKENENPYEVKVGKKKKGKIKEAKIEEIKENMPVCDLILNVVVTPIIKKEESKPKYERSGTVKRRKSVRFSDVNEERIIPNKEELQMMEERNELFDINTRVISNGLKENGGNEDSFDMSSIDRLSFYEQPKKKKKGLQNEAFNEDYSIEENISEMAKTMDNFQAEIDNSINEEKLKTIELEDIMVGDVNGDNTGKHEKTAEGTKLKFYRASFGKSISYFNNQIGPKKSYKHLIKGDITVAFKNSNLHTIEGYATRRIEN